MTETTQTIKENVNVFKKNRYEMRFQWVWQQRQYEEECPTHHEYFLAIDDKDAVKQVRDWLENEIDEIEIECVQEIRSVDIKNPSSESLSHKVKDRNILIRDLRSHAQVMFDILTDGTDSKQIPLETLNFWQKQLKTE